jgi:hypothetical protein
MHDHKRNWKLYTQELIDRGDFTLYISEQALELIEKGPENRKPKRGRPFVFNPYTILLGFTAKIVYKLGYRQTNGFMKMVKERLRLEVVPNFRTLWWRISKIKKFDIKFRTFKTPDGKFVGIIDSTGQKKNGRHEWCTKKFHLRRGWVKTHFLMDDIGQFRNLSITKEHVHDSKEFRRLTRPFLKDMRKLIADPAYDSDDIFGYLETHNVIPIIPVRKNGTIKGSGKFRKKQVIEQLGLRHGPGRPSVLDMQTEKHHREVNQDRWKNRVGYHFRSSIESRIWSFKSKFGENVFSKREDMRQKELVTKINIHNVFTVPDSKFVF